MTHETKAGLAVSCSFLCLVGVVLSSKLWEGRAANAGTLPETEKKEQTGPNPQPLANNVAPESKIPKLQPPPGNENGLQLVTGTGNPNPRANVNDLFKDEEDPFQGTPSQNDDVARNQPVVPNIPSPTFNNQPVVNAPIVAQPIRDPAPDNPPRPTTLPDPSKPPVPSFDDFAKNFKQTGAGSGTAGTSGLGNAQPAAQTGAGRAFPTPDSTKPVVPSFDDATLAAQKKAQETAAALNGMGAQKPTLSPSDEFAKELARQKSLEQAANAGKDTAAGADAALAASRQQLSNGAAALNDPAKNGLYGGSGNTAGAGMNIPVRTGQPRLPANQPDGYPGQTEPAGIGTGSRAPRRFPWETPLLRATTNMRNSRAANPRPSTKRRRLTGASPKSASSR